MISYHFAMKNALLGWTLIEGRIGMGETANPKVSEIVAAMEAIHPEMESPFVIIESPTSEDGSFQNYCQVLADECGYVCETRIFNGDDFRHSRAYLPDAEGVLGNNDDPQFPSLSQAIQILTGFIADPNKLPAVNPVEWLDVSDQFKE